MNEWEAAVIVAQNDSDVRVALCIFATPLAVSESEWSLQNTANQTNDNIYISLKSNAFVGYKLQQQKLLFIINMLGYEYSSCRCCECPCPLSAPIQTHNTHTHAL